MTEKRRQRFRKVLLWLAGTVLSTLLGVVVTTYYMDPSRQRAAEQERRRQAPVETLDSAVKDRQRLTEATLASAIDKYKSLLPLVDDAQYPLSQTNKVRLYSGLSRAYADLATLRSWRGLSTGDFTERAQSFASKAIDTAPEAPESLIASAYSYDAAEIGKVKYATKAKVLEILKKGINTLEVQYLAKTCEANDEAKSFLDNLHPDDVSDLRILIDAAIDFGKLAKAHPTEKQKYIKRGEEFLERAAQVHADNPMVRFAQGYLSAIKENYIEARDYYLKAVELEPQFPKARNNLGFTYAADRDYLNAKKQFGAACQADSLPNTSLHRCLINLASASLESGSNDEACQAWKRASEIPDANQNAETFLGLAMCDYVREQKNAASSNFCQAVEVGKQHDQDLLDLAWFEKQNAGTRELGMAKALLQMNKGKCPAAVGQPVAQVTSRK
jgi:Tfp pilus assembly protein PilF